MKNLLLVQERLSQVALASLARGGDAPAELAAALDLACVCLDAPSGRLFALTRTLQFLSIDIASGEVTYQCSLASDELLDADDALVGAHYLPELESVHVCSAHGNLLTVDPDGRSPPIIVGSISVGIAAMAWSPDEELCVIYNCADQVVVMTKDFDVMYEIDLFAATTRTPAQIAEAHARYGYGSISWRGDGQFFVINALNPSTSERVCIVFDRQLEQQSISSGVKAAPLDGSADGMDAPIVWRPSGNLIFSAAHRQISSDLTKREVWLWEKNGLRHGEIALGNVVRDNGANAAATAAAAAKTATKKAKKRRAGGDDDDDDDADEDDEYTEEVDESAIDSSIASATDAFVRDLAWNADSDILAVKLEDKATSAQSVVLYTTSNYHWYLKQELRPSTPGAQLHLRWHAEDARRLLIVESTGLVRFIDLVWDVTVNSVSQSRLATVIDGQSALLTPLAKAAVPPPMSAWRINIPVDAGRINSVSTRASLVGAAQVREGKCRFNMPNQALESTAFRALPMPEGVLPPYASEDLFSPTSDLVIITSAGTGYLVENVEGALGNAFSPASGVAVASLTGVHQFTLRSDDFPLGCLRGIEWLDADPAEAASAASPSDLSISSSRPAVLFGVESVAGRPDALVELEIFDGEIQSMFRTPLPPATPRVLRAVPRKTFGHVFVQVADGRVLRYLPASWQTDLSVDDRLPILESPSASLALPCACPWFDVVSLGGVLHSTGRDALGKLYIGSSLLTPQSSSFLASQHPLYMTFTILGAQNAVFLIDKSRTLADNLGPEFRSDPHNVRLIERGGTLLCLVPSLTVPRLLLQMPRGNLELIYPRNFNLAAINSALSALRLREALVNVRRNKIDSNLLFDHFGFDGFARVARQFVKQVGMMDDTPGQGVELINLFLSALTDESSIDTQYVKYAPMPLTAEAEDLLRTDEADEANAGRTSGRDRVRETLLRSVAAARAVVEEEDQRSEAGSLDSGVGRDLQSHDAVGEAAPYNYVPRKPGQARRNVKTRAQKEAMSAATKSREEARRDAQRKERAMRESLAEQFESAAAVTTAQRTSKVNFACDVMREVLMEHEAANKNDPARRGRFTLCILTTYLKSEPKNYDAALQMVKNMRDEEKATAAANAKPSATAPGKSRSAAKAAAAAEQSSLENKSLIYRGYLGALQYMIFLSDIQTLYRSALGIYDFELVRLVAQYSHMDPKEYLAFLDRLQALDAPTTQEIAAAAGSVATTKKRQPHFQHYQIDVYLQRWSKALTSLLAAWAAQEIPHDEEHWTLVLQLVKDHPDLYTQAIELVTPETVRDQTRLVLGGGGSFGGSMYGAQSTPAPFDPMGGLPAHFFNPSLAPMPVSAPVASTFSSSANSSTGTSDSTPSAPDTPELNAYFSLVRAYASHLSVSKSSVSIRHAAHAYLLCCEYKLAVQCFKESGEWKEAIVLAYQLGYQPEQIQQLAYELAAHLRTETKTAGAAAQLLVDYCDDVDEAVVILISGELWFDILRICYSKGRQDLLETHVQSEVMAAYARHIKHIQTHRQRYTYAVHRLRVIRRVKLLFPPTEEEVGPGGGGNERDDDLMSIVSGMTASTSYSAASASLSEASAFSGRSTSTVASTSSIFSIQSDDRREMTPDERRIARHQEKLKRKQASKRVKEGSVFEEDMMITEVIATTPLDKHKERMSELVHALLHFGYVDQSRTLQYELSEFLSVVSREESTPMPMMENPTPEQREALIKYWNWPQMAHPERGALPKTDHLLMPFLFPKPSTLVAAQQAEQTRAQVKEDAAAAGVAPGAMHPEAVMDEEGDMFGGFM